LSSCSMGHQLHGNQESKILQCFATKTEYVAAAECAKEAKYFKFLRGAHQRRSQINTDGGQSKCHLFGEVWSDD